MPTDGAALEPGSRRRPEGRAESRPESRSGRRAGRALGWWSLVAWAALLGATGAALVRAQMADLLQPSPALALRFDAGNAAALTRLAEERLAGIAAPRIDLRGARAAARAALSRQPVLPAAWRILGVTGSSELDEAIARLEFAESLSRRDIPTQLALIEYRSAQGDVAATLRHYDTIMRVSPAFDQVLFPLLAEAVANPIVLREAALVLREAPWRRRFFSYLPEAGVSFARQADLFEALARTAPLPEADIVALQAGRAALAGEYRAALRLYRLVDPAGAAMRLRNPDFAGQEGVAPFDWQLDTDGVLNVSVSGREAPRLEMTSVRGDGGRAARQLLYLPPGRFRVAARTGPIEGYGAATLALSLACANGARLADFEASAARERALGGGFAVPASCPVQWLSIALEQDTDGGRNGAWIGALALAPAGG